MPIPLHLILISIAAIFTFILLIMSLIGAFRSRPSNDPNDDPRCGACGCILAHPADGICPTCRSPLSAVGMVLPFSKKRTPGWTSRQAFFKITAFPLALWTLFITGFAIGATYAIDQWILPYTWQTNSTLHARPRSSALQSVVISTLEEYHAHGRAQFDSPSAIKTARLEFKTDSDSHTLDIDLLATSFSYSDAAGKLITHDGLPAKNDLLSFMRDRGLVIDPGATQDAGIIANMLAKLAPGANLIGSGEVRSSSNLTTISLNGGQWKSTIPLQTLSMSISPAAWFLGLVLIIYLQRNRRAKLAAALLTPPITTPPAQREGDDIGGWDITLDANAFGPQPPALQVPPSAPRAV